MAVRGRSWLAGTIPPAGTGGSLRAEAASNARETMLEPAARVLLDALTRHVTVQWSGSARELNTLLFSNESTRRYRSQRELVVDIKRFQRQYRRRGWGIVDNGRTSTPRFTITPPITQAEQCHHDTTE